MGGNRFNTEIGATGMKPAVLSEEWAYHSFIALNQEDYDTSHFLIAFTQSRSSSSRNSVFCASTAAALATTIKSVPAGLILLQPP